MPLLEYYVQDAENEEWGIHRCFYHPEYDRLRFTPIPINTFLSIPLSDHMGYNWSSTTHLLKTLATHRALRQQIIREAATVWHTEKQDTINVTHPLLQPPLCLGRTDSDRVFQTRIEVRLTLYRIQVVLERL